MPNGGSDCCGTCWFNRTNRGERDWLTHADRSLPPYCEIRDLAIEDPFYTYCANHPHRRPDRDPIPIGPVTCYDKRNDGTSPSPRYVWKLSPDSEEIRQHLLTLLNSLSDHLGKDYYPLGHGLGQAIVWQLGEFKERRAVGGLERIRKHDGWGLGSSARKALARIRAGRRGSRTGVQ